jgi:hypothetical protein
MNMAPMAVATRPAAGLMKVEEEEAVGEGVGEDAQLADQVPTLLTVEHWKLVTYWLLEQ